MANENKPVEENKKVIAGKEVHRINDVDLVDAASDVADSYLRLQTNISFARLDKEIRNYALTSANEAEGKTTTICNLAYLYAQKGLKVAVVDLDLRRPSVHRLMKLQDNLGVVDYVKGDVSSPADICQHSEKGGFDVYVPGSHTPFPGQVFASPRLKEFYAELQKEYDFVLTDTPPILVLNDALQIAPLVEGFVVVCAQHVTRKRDLIDTLDNMTGKGIPVLGIYMTMCDNYRDSGHGYGYGYSYSYNHGYGYKGTYRHGGYAHGGYAHGGYSQQAVEQEEKKEDK